MGKESEVVDIRDIGSSDCVLAPRASCGVGVDIAKGVDGLLSRSARTAERMDGKFCVLSGDPAADGVDPWRAGRIISWLFGAGIVNFPRFEAARLSCLGRWNVSKDVVCDGCGLGGKIASWGTSSLMDGR